MNTTNPIVLQQHITHAQGMALKEDGIQIIEVGFRLIANCRTQAEEDRVKALNENKTKRAFTSYNYYPAILDEQNA